MFKKSISVLLAVVMVIGVFTAFPLTANSQESDKVEVGANVEMNHVGGSYGVNLSHTGYQSPPNPYAYPQCTWYCWGRAYEKLGIRLPGWSHAYTWDDSADANPNYSVGTEARANSIMVENSSGAGHVMFVEKVENGYAYITEGNYLDKDYHEDRINLSTMVRDSWTTHQLSPVRYIYLDGGYANIGDSFYAFIINTSMWKHLTVDQNLNVSIRSEKSHYCADQVFKFERQSDGSYKIISTANGYCLDVSNASTEAGANVGVYTGNDTDAQRWYLIGNSGDYYIKSKCSECVLDIYSGHSDEGTNVQMYTENGTAAQKFQVYKIEDRPFASDIGTQFTAPILNTKSWITLENDEDNNLSLQKETGMSRQLWQFKKQKDGSYKIYSCYDGKCIDLYWAYHEDGTNISQCKENSNDAQRWYFYSTNGGYVIQSKESGKVFDVYSGHFEYGTNIQAWTWNDTDSQKFTVYKGDECKLSSPALTIEAGTSTTDTVFRWNNVYGESGYNLKIWKDKIGEGEADILVNDADIETKLTLPAGTYQAVVEAYHFYESKKSNTATFTVVQGEDLINPEVSILGDSDGDGTVTIVDATAIQRYLAQYPVSNEEALLRCGDVNGGGLDIMDATAIQRYLAHYDDPYHIGEPIK